MKSLRIWSWFIKAFIDKHKKIMVLASGFGIVLALFVIWILPYVPRPNPSLKVGVVDQVFMGQLPDYIASKVTGSLVTVMPDGSAGPGLAYDWSISDDGRVYTFFIQDNLTWQDGSTLKASDFPFTFEDVKTEVLDDHTLRFTLQDPLASFPLLLTQPMFKNHTIGTGVYRIRSYSEKNGALSQMILESPKDSLRLRFYPNLQTAVMAFKLGEIDRIQDIYMNPFADDSIWKPYLNVTTVQDTGQHLALFLDNEKDSLFDEKNKTLKQALAYATHKPTNDSRALSPISKTSWAYNSSVKPYEYNPDRAKELMEKFLGDLSKADTITITISTTQAFLDIAEKIKQDWESVLGIHVNVTVINTIPDHFQILLASQEIPPDPDQYTLWHSTQSQNRIHLNNVRLDKLLEDARKETDKTKRLELYQDFQRFFVEESSVIFLEYPQIYTVERQSQIKPWVNMILNLRRG